MVMNVKNTKLIFCFVLFGFLTVLSVFLGAFHTFSFCGFALDSQKLLYVGRDNAIEVYSGTEKILEINPQTSRSYAFTVTDDTIVLSTAEFVYEIDLKGNVIKKSEDVNSKTYTDIEKSKKHFVTSDNEYFLKNNFGRYKIIDKNKNVLYETSAKEFTVKLLEDTLTFVKDYEVSSDGTSTLPQTGSAIDGTMAMGVGTSLMALGTLLSRRKRK